MARCVEFLGEFEHGLRAEGGPGAVAGEQGLDLADDLLWQRLPRSMDLNHFFFERGESLPSPLSISPPRLGGNMGYVFT